MDGWIVLKVDQLVLLELLLLGLLSMLLGPDLENELLLLNPYPLPPIKLWALLLVVLVHANCFYWKLVVLAGKGLRQERKVHLQGELLGLDLTKVMALLF